MPETLKNIVIDIFKLLSAILVLVFFFGQSALLQTIVFPKAQ